MPVRMLLLALAVWKPLARAETAVQCDVDCLQFYRSPCVQPNVCGACLPDLTPPLTGAASGNSKCEDTIGRCTDDNMCNNGFCKNDGLCSCNPEWGGVYCTEAYESSGYSDVGLAGTVIGWIVGVPLLICALLCCYAKVESGDIKLCTGNPASHGRGNDDMELGRSTPAHRVFNQHRAVPNHDPGEAAEEEDAPLARLVDPSARSAPQPAPARKQREIEKRIRIEPYSLQPSTSAPSPTSARAPGAEAADPPDAAVKIQGLQGIMPQITAEQARSALAANDWHIARAVHTVLSEEQV